LVAYGITWGYLPVSFLNQAFANITPELLSQVAAEFLRVLGDCKTDLTEKEMIDLLGKLFKPENRNEVFLNGFVAEKELAYLFPTTKAKNHIETMLQDGSSADDIVSWIEKNSSGVRFDTNFAKWVMRTVLLDAWTKAKSVVPQTDFGDDKDKKQEYEDALAKETRNYVKNYCKVLRLILKDSSDVHVACLYEIQALAHSSELPKAVVNLVFVCLFEEDVVLEKAIRDWRDDNKDTTPGKQKTLFAVSKWLQWLDEAENEDDEEEEEDEDDKPRSS